MKTIEIYSTDLTEEAKQRILEEYGVDVNDYNWDVFPMATLCLEEDADSDLKYGHASKNEKILIGVK